MSIPIVYLYEYLSEINDYTKLKTKKDCNKIIEIAEEFFTKNQLKKAPFYLMAIDRLEELGSPKIDTPKNIQTFSLKHETKCHDENTPRSHKLA
jgi:hypothetical protein